MKEDIGVFVGSLLYGHCFGLDMRYPLKFQLPGHLEGGSVLGGDGNFRRLGLAGGIRFSDVTGDRSLIISCSWPLFCLSLSCWLLSMK